MSVIYGPVDTLARHPIQVHLQFLEDQRALQKVLTLESKGMSTEAPEVSAPLKGGLMRHWSSIAANNLGDLYLRRHVNGAKALIGWSGKSSFSIERANEQGMETFVFRASPHMIEVKRRMDEEYDRFGMRRRTSVLNVWKESYEYQEADWILTVSEPAAESFARYGVDRDKIITIPYDLNLDPFLEVEDKSNEDTFTVCTATTIDVWRGVQYLLEGWKQFADNKSDVELLVAGSKTQKFPRSLYQKFSDRSDVEFLGYVSNIRDLYARSDVFALAALADGGPAGPAEAMAAGLPTIVSEGMGASQDVTDGENGFVVPIQDGSAIADRLDRLYGSPELCKSMGTRARESISGIEGRQVEAFRHLFENYIEPL